jgi:hypothetical protein
MIALVEFILFMALDGRQIEVNPEQVVTVAKPRDDEKLVTDKARCVITLTDGKIISVAEDCISVKLRLEGSK